MDQERQHSSRSSPPGITRGCGAPTTPSLTGLPSEWMTPYSPHHRQASGCGPRLLQSHLPHEGAPEPGLWNLGSRPQLQARARLDQRPRRSTSSSTSLGGASRWGLWTLGLTHSHPAFGACAKVGPGCEAPTAMTSSGTSGTRHRPTSPSHPPARLRPHGLQWARNTRGWHCWARDASFVGVAPDVVLGAYSDGQLYLEH